jgi:hypothetical protein
VRILVRVIVAGLLSGAAPLPAIAAPGQGAANVGTTIVGTVVLTDAAGETFAGEGVPVVMACGADGMTRTGVGDEHGAFRFPDVPVGSCSIEADVQGFVAPAVVVVTAPGETVETVEVDLHLGVVPLSVGVSVARTAASLPPQRPRRSCMSMAGRPGGSLAAACAR